METNLKKINGSGDLGINIPRKIRNLLNLSENNISEFKILKNNCLQISIKQISPKKEASVNE